MGRLCPLSGRIVNGKVADSRERRFFYAEKEYVCVKKINILKYLGGSDLFINLSYIFAPN